MKKEELIQRISDLEAKITAIGDIQTKAGEVVAILNQTTQNAAQIDQERQKATTHVTEIQNLSDQMNNLKAIIENASKIAETYQGLVDQNVDETQSLKKHLNTLIKNSSDLEITIKNQLGLVSAITLSDAFQNEAEKLKGSIEYWFKWLKWLVLILVASAVGIVIWEIQTGNISWNGNFLIKFTITTPVIFLLIFVSKQYGREKRLLEEYVFKSTVAKSLEAYRKLIKDEGGAQENEQGKILEFIISSVNNIYSSPTENAYKYRSFDEQDVNIFSQIADIFKKFIK